MLISTNGVIGNVEGMEPSRNLWVVPTFYYKRVAFASDYIDLRDQQSINIPGDAPANVACIPRIYLSKIYY
jgi:hypothetical protein